MKLLVLDIAFGKNQVVKDREVQFKGVTTNKVRVIYSNKDEGEV